MNRRPSLETILLVGAVVLAAFLRFYALDGTSLWSDEGNTWALIQRSMGQIAADAARDIHPPGYYWALKLWSGLFGFSSTSIRAFSAVAGTLTVLMTGLIARLFCSPRHRRLLFAPLAALIAALNPFQVYYSQEARMYMLLTLEAALVMWATVGLLRPVTRPLHGMARPGARLVLYTAAATAGLWTHYSFPVVMAAAVAAFALTWLWSRRRAGDIDGRLALRFLAANAVAVLCFLPWLPTAIRQVLSWPQGGAEMGLLAGMTLTVQTLLVGPLDGLPAPLWPWLLAAAILPLVGAAALARQRGSLAVIFWLMGPVGLMFALGLFTDAFLKFLLVASPAWALLIAAAPHVVSLERRPDDLAGQPQTTAATRIVQVLIALGALLVALYLLPGYYNSPTARDGYQSVAAYLAQVADPATDLVLLNAPGQQDVWGYYDPGIPVLALPASRPPDPAATQAALARATADRERIYALFWATDESDPAHVVEEWLDRHAFKGPERWQGNVRFVTYQLAPPDECWDLDPPALFGEMAVLATACSTQSGIRAGDLLPVTLVWRALTDIGADYAISVQLQDDSGRVVAQHDGRPAGGSHPTGTWETGMEIGDNHSLLIPFGTPPGTYTLTVTLYEPATGRRIPTPAGETVPIGTVVVDRAEQPAPTALLPLTYALNQRLGPLTLLGYSVHGLGFAHAPETPVAPGEPVEYILYWQAPTSLPETWPERATMEFTAGAATATMDLVPGYPTGQWTPGEIVRAVVVVPNPGDGADVALGMGDDQVLLELPPE